MIGGMIGYVVTGGVLGTLTSWVAFYFYRKLGIVELMRRAAKAEGTAAGCVEFAKRIIAENVELTNRVSTLEIQVANLQCRQELERDWRQQHARAVRRVD